MVPLYLIFTFLLFTLSKCQPESDNSCSYYREFTVKNEGAVNEEDLDVFVELPMDFMFEKTTCEDFILKEIGINTEGEFYPFFYVESNCNILIVDIIRLWVRIDELAIQETKTYRLFYGCDIVPNAKNTVPANDWIFPFASEECPDYSNFEEYREIDDKILRISSTFGNEDYVAAAHAHGVVGAFDPSSDWLNVSTSANTEAVYGSHTHQFLVNAKTNTNDPTPQRVHLKFCYGKKIDIFNSSVVFTDELGPTTADLLFWKPFSHGDDHLIVGHKDTGSVLDLVGTKTHSHNLLGLTGGASPGEPFGGGTNQMAEDSHSHNYMGGTFDSNHMPPFFAYKTWISKNDNKVQDNFYFLSNGNNPPIGFEQYHESDGYFLMVSSGTYLFAKRGGSFEHNHTTNVATVSISGGTNFAYISTTLNAVSTYDHTHECKIPTQTARVPEYPHLNLTMFRRKTMSGTIIVNFPNEEHVAVFCDPPCGAHGTCINNSPVDSQRFCDCNTGWGPTTSPVTPCGGQIPSILDPIWYVVFGISGVSVVVVIAILLCICIIVVIIIVTLVIVKGKGKERKIPDDVELETTKSDETEKEDKSVDGKSNRTTSKRDSKGVKQTLKEFFGALKRKSKTSEDEGEESQPRIIVHKSLSEIKMEEVKLVSLIGEGGSDASVYKCEWNRATCAFKLFKTSSVFHETKDFKEFEKEVEIIGSIQHPNIIQHYGWVIEGPRVGILLEFCELGELGKYIRTKKLKNESVSIEEKMRMCIEISEGMYYLHKNKIIHRDIKSANVLLNRGAQVKIIDFGLAKIVNVSQNLQKQTVRVGTSYYMAPEVLTGKYDSKCDVFSFSVVMYEVFTENFRPYEGRDLDGVIELKVANDENFRPIVKDEYNVPEEVTKMMKVCWSHSPSARPSFDEISKQLKEIDNKLKQKNEKVQEKKEKTKGD